MKAIQGIAIYVLWLRELKRLLRAKSRLIGTLLMPLFFLGFLGMGFKRSSIPGVPAGMEYSVFLIPGILGMSILFSSTFAGLSVIWDREFGFLKEIMVAPVSRVSIVLGRIAGGITTSLFQALVILLISIIMGFRPQNWLMLLPGLLFMTLISMTFIGLGLAFASRMRDMQGFNLVMNFVIFPLFFLSGALFPLDSFPTWLRILSRFDPLTYGVDGLRAALLGKSELPLLLDLGILSGCALLSVIIGAWSFEKSESI
ncbi:MAG: ABC transporter permease [Candidatus Aminicenantes bacterium]|nr:ABC transporter permease [Candidatus Aminicenantes bacterium]